MRYLVTDATFWENLPYYQELTCGRVRFSKKQAQFTGPTFDLKGLALSYKFQHPGTWLIREQEYKPDHWIYEAIIGKTSPGSGDEGD